MLKFQTGDYCMLIWDDTETDMHSSLDSLYNSEDLPKPKCDEVSLLVKPFDRGDAKAKALKVLEEAGEARAALQYEGEMSTSYLEELMDTVTACINAATAAGMGIYDMQKTLDNIEDKNRKRGYYDE